MRTCEIGNFDAPLTSNTPTASELSPPARFNFRNQLKLHNEEVVEISHYRVFHI